MYYMLHLYYILLLGACEELLQGSLPSVLSLSEFVVRDDVVVRDVELHPLLAGGQEHIRKR
jgi:hypothetical protein